MYMENVFATLSAALNTQDYTGFLEKKAWKSSEH